MDALRFDQLIRDRARGLPRRTVLAGLIAALAMAPSFSSVPSSARKRKKNFKRNEFGCINVGGKCYGKDNVCCSGRCDGKKPEKGKADKRKCVAHHESSCRAGQDSCTTPVDCTSSTGFAGKCFTTTGNAGYCGVGNACSACKTDADCVRIFGAVFGPGAACVKCDPNGCGTFESATICKSHSPD